MTNGHQKDNESAQEPVYEKQEQTTDTQVEEPKNDAASPFLKAQILKKMHALKS